MIHPVHPGENILFVCLGVVGEDEGAVEVAEAAAKLGVPCDAFQRVVDGQAPVTPDLARRMAAVGWSLRNSGCAAKPLMTRLRPRSRNPRQRSEHLRPETSIGCFESLSREGGRPQPL